MIKLSKLMSKIITVIFYVIIFLRMVGLIIFTYYFVVKKKMSDASSIAINNNILNLQDIYYKLNNIFSVSVAVITVILFNPFYTIKYKLTNKFKSILYYMGLLVLYDFAMKYYTQTTKPISYMSI
jgi:hypothetical protein